MEKRLNFNGKRLYTQCNLKQYTKKGFKIHTAWIPKKFAIKGKTLTIKNLKGEWKVTHVFSTKSETYMKDISHQYRAYKDLCEK